jgi:hypothetical protein
MDMKTHPGQGQDGCANEDEQLKPYRSRGKQHKLHEL